MQNEPGMMSEITMHIYHTATAFPLLKTEKFTYIWFQNLLTKHLLINSSFTAIVSSHITVDFNLILINFKIKSKRLV